MINVQDPENFQSLQMNADLWNDTLIKDLVRHSFHFAQRVLPSADAQWLKDSYHLHVLPTVLIIDPNTGQKMHEWRGLPQEGTLHGGSATILGHFTFRSQAGALHGLWQLDLSPS